MDKQSEAEFSRVLPEEKRPRGTDRCSRLAVDQGQCQDELTGTPFLHGGWPCPTAPRLCDFKSLSLQRKRKHWVCVEHISA